MADPGTIGAGVAELGSGSWRGASGDTHGRSASSDPVAGEADRGRDSGEERS